MQNPFQNLLGKMLSQRLQPLQNLSQMATGVSNPQGMIQQMLQNDPRTQQVMDYVNKNGGNAQQLFYQMAQQKGIDPNVIINQIKSMKF